MNQYLIFVSTIKFKFEKFERKRCVYYGKDIRMLAINTHLFHSLTKDDILKVINMMSDLLEGYYRNIEGTL